MKLEAIWNIIGGAKKSRVRVSKFIGVLCVHRVRLLERFHLLQAGGKWPSIYDFVRFCGNIFLPAALPSNMLWHVRTCMFEHGMFEH